MCRLLHGVVAVHAEGGGAIWAENDFHHGRLKSAIAGALEGANRVIAFEGIAPPLAHVCAISVCRGVAATGANLPFRDISPYAPFCTGWQHVLVR